MRDLKRVKINNSAILKMMISTSLALATTISFAGYGYAQPTSNNLPVPNFVSGANMKYKSGYTINNNAGSLDLTAQTDAANAANSSSKLNIDLGTIANNVADIRYNTFNVGSGKTVNFNFGASGQAALNRITRVGDQYASKVFGNITQSGQGGAVFLINPNGILFGSRSKVNVGSFTVSTLNLVTDDSLTTLALSRGDLAPKGIVLQKGAKITATRGANFASDGILDKGARISSKGNVQLVTGDGVTFSYSADYSPQLVSPDNVVPSTVRPDQVTYPNDESNSNNTINVHGGSIKGRNIEFVSKINSVLDTPLNAIVNLDGIINAKADSENSGNVIIFARAFNVPNAVVINSIGVNLDNSLKVPGSLTINSDRLQAKNLAAGRDIDITLGLGGSSIGNINARNNINLNLDNSTLETRNLTSGNNITINGISSIINTQNIKAGNDFIFNFDAGTGNSAGNIRAGRDVGISLNVADLTTRNITAGRNVSSDSGGSGGLNAQNILAGGDVGINVTQAGSNVRNITAKGLVGFSAGEGSISANNITAKADVNINGGLGSVLSAGNIKAGNDISLSGSDSTSVQAENISAGNDANLSAQLGSDITAGNIHAGRNILIAAEPGGNFRTKNISANGTVAMEGGEVGFNTGNIKAQDIRISAGVADIKTGNLKAFENILFNLSDATITARNLTAGNNINISLERSDLKAGNLTAGNNIDINADNGSSITTRNLHAGQAINVLASQGAFGSLRAGRDINLTVRQGTLTFGNLSSQGSVNLGGGGVIQTGDIFANKGLSSGDSGFAAVLGNVKTNGAISAASEAPFIAGNINAAKEIQISVGDVNVGNLKSGDFITLSGNSIRTGNIIAPNDIIVSGGSQGAGSATTGNITGRNITLFSINGEETGSITTKNIKARGNVDMSAGLINLNGFENGTIKTGNIKAGGNLTGLAFSPTSSPVRTGTITMKNLTIGNDVTLAAHEVNTGKIQAGGKINIIED